MGLGSFLKVVLRNFDVLAGPFVSLVYPLYASMKAIETKSNVDDHQWLTYWILHSMITLFELTFATIIQLLPFWSYAKLIFTSWLVLPYFSGAAYVYQHFIRPLATNTSTVNVWYVPHSKDAFAKPDDALRAAEKFIKQNGTYALGKVIGKSEKVSKSKRHSTRSIIEEVRAKQEADARRAEEEADRIRSSSYDSIFGDGYVY